MQRMYFDAPGGKLVAYLTPPPRQPGKHPAIIWITGGDNNTIGDVWSPMSADNDQTAAAYRNAGIVTMYPSQRGGNDNPGVRESFYGEVDDILAAADYLATLDHVDPQRIYLGGHSTGGTLALLVSEASPRFRSVFAFGPAGTASYYGGRFTEAMRDDETEIALRSPIHWLGSIRSPTFVIEGENGNSDALRRMQQEAKAIPSVPLHFVAVPGASHFSVLAPANALIAGRILADTGATPSIALDAAEVRAVAEPTVMFK